MRTDIIVSDDSIRKARSTARSKGGIEGDKTSVGTLVPIGDLIDEAPTTDTGHNLDGFGSGSNIKKGMGAGFDLSAVPGMYDGRPERYFDNTDDFRAPRNSTKVQDSQHTRDVQIGSSLLDSLDDVQVTESKLPEAEYLPAVQRQQEAHQQQVRGLGLILNVMAVSIHICILRDRHAYNEPVHIQMVQMAQLHEQQQRLYQLQQQQQQQQQGQPVGGFDLLALGADPGQAITGNIMGQVPHTGGQMWGSVGGMPQQQQQQQQMGQMPGNMGVMGNMANMAAMGGIPNSMPLPPTFGTSGAAGHNMAAMGGIKNNMNNGVANVGAVGHMHGNVGAIGHMQGNVGAIGHMQGNVGAIGDMGADDMPSQAPPPPPK